MYSQSSIRECSYVLPASAGRCPAAFSISCTTTTCRSTRGHRGDCGAAAGAGTSSGHLPFLVGVQAVCGAQSRRDAELGETGAESGGQPCRAGIGDRVLAGAATTGHHGGECGIAGDDVRVGGRMGASRQNVAHAARLRMGVPSDTARGGREGNVRTRQALHLGLAGADERGNRSSGECSRGEHERRHRYERAFGALRSCRKDA